MLYFHKDDNKNEYIMGKKVREIMNIELFLNRFAITTKLFVKC